jgi:hypothetical protein
MIKLDSVCSCSFIDAMSHMPRTLIQIVLLALIAVYGIVLYTFFIKPLILPSPRVVSFAFRGMEGVIRFDRGLAFRGDCILLQWQFSGADTIELEGEPVPDSGERRVCIDDPAVFYTFRVNISGIVNLYRISPQSLWTPEYSMLYPGIVGLGLLLIAAAYVVDVGAVRSVVRWAAAAVNCADPRLLNAVVSLWMIAALFVYWTLRGSPGLVSFAVWLEDARLTLRTLFSGLY